MHRAPSRGISWPPNGSGRLPFLVCQNPVAIVFFLIDPARPLKGLCNQSGDHRPHSKRNPIGHKSSGEGTAWGRLSPPSQRFLRRPVRFQQGCVWTPPRVLLLFSIARAGEFVSDEIPPINRSHCASEQTQPLCATPKYRGHGAGIHDPEVLIAVVEDNECTLDASFIEPFQTIRERP